MGQESAPKPGSSERTPKSERSEEDVARCEQYIQLADELFAQNKFALEQLQKLVPQKDEQGQLIYEDGKLGLSEDDLVKFKNLSYSTFFTFHKLKNGLTDALARLQNGEQLGGEEYFAYATQLKENSQEIEKLYKAYYGNGSPSPDEASAAENESEEKPTQKGWEVDTMGTSDSAANPNSMSPEKPPSNPKAESSPGPAPEKKTVPDAEPVAFDQLQKQSAAEETPVPEASDEGAEQTSKATSESAAEKSLQALHRAAAVRYESLQQKLPAGMGRVPELTQIEQELTNLEERLREHERLSEEEARAANEPQASYAMYGVYDVLEKEEQRRSVESAGRIREIERRAAKINTTIDDVAEYFSIEVPAVESSDADPNAAWKPQLEEDIDNYIAGELSGSTSTEQKERPTEANTAPENNAATPAAVDVVSAESIARRGQMRELFGAEIKEQAKTRRAYQEELEKAYKSRSLIAKLFGRPPKESEALTSAYDLYTEARQKYAIKLQQEAPGLIKSNTDLDAQEKSQRVSTLSTGLAERFVFRNARRNAENIHELRYSPQQRRVWQQTMGTLAKNQKVIIGASMLIGAVVSGPGYFLQRAVGATAAAGASAIAMTMFDPSVENRRAKLEKAVSSVKTDFDPKEISALEKSMTDAQRAYERMRTYRAGAGLAAGIGAGLAVGHFSDSLFGSELNACESIVEGELYGGPDSVPPPGVTPDIGEMYAAPDSVPPGGVPEGGVAPAPGSSEYPLPSQEAPEGSVPNKEGYLSYYFEQPNEAVAGSEAADGGVASEVPPPSKDQAYYNYDKSLDNKGAGGSVPQEPGSPLSSKDQSYHNFDKPLDKGAGAAEPTWPIPGDRPAPSVPESDLPIPAERPVPPEAATDGYRPYYYETPGEGPAASDDYLHYYNEKAPGLSADVPAPEQPGALLDSLPIIDEAPAESLYKVQTGDTVWDLLEGDVDGVPAPEVVQNLGESTQQALIDRVRDYLVDNPEFARDVIGIQDTTPGRLWLFEGQSINLEALHQLAEVVADTEGYR
jgi:hypothetical protein